MNNLYSNKNYLKSNPKWHTEDSGWKALQISKILSKNEIVPKTIVEIGCGAGEILSNLSVAFPNATLEGYDISPDAHELSKKIKSDRIQFHLEDLTEKEVRFDLLLMIDVFEHVDDYLGFLRKCKNKSTYKVFHIPLDLTVNKLLRTNSLLRNRYDTGHLHYFCKETALATLKDCGYEIIDQRYTKWGLEMEQTTLLKKIGKIPLYILDIISTDLAAKLLGGNSLIVLAK